MYGALEGPGWSTEPGIWDHQGWGARGATPQPSARVPRLMGGGWGATGGSLANTCNNKCTFRDKVACSLSDPHAAWEVMAPLGSFCTHLLLSRKGGVFSLRLHPGPCGPWGHPRRCMRPSSCPFSDPLKVV